MTDLILISCSDHKMPYGRRMVEGTDPIPWLRDAELRQKLLKTRSLVFHYIKTNKLCDAERKQGNRGYDPVNRDLVKGPDFGGKDDSGLYLPACLRYIGRFFREVRGNLSDDDALKLWERSCGGYQVLIVSGLYGLVSPFDPIQEYTCHFTDRIIGTRQGLQIIWRNVLAEIICHLTKDTGSGCKAKLLDLLSEESYQDAFDWGLISKHATCFNRAYKLKAGPETLINSARFFRSEFLHDEKEPPELFHDKYIYRKYLDKPRDRILFEAQPKTTRKQVAREGIAEFIPQLKQLYGEAWDPLPNRVKNEIANSEYSYQHHCDLRDFDFTAAGICLSKAVEIWVEEKVVRPLVGISELAKLLRNIRKREISPSAATLGDITEFLDEAAQKFQRDLITRRAITRCFSEINSEAFRSFTRDLIEIKDEYRNSWVHKKIMGRKEYENFRELSPSFFKRWVPKWRHSQ